MRERAVEHHLVEKLQQIGLACVKFVPEQMPGMPDRMVLLPDGRVLWVELKTKGGRLSELQKYRHVWLRSLGHRVEVVWNKEQVDNLVSGLENDQVGRRE